MSDQVVKGVNSFLHIFQLGTSQSGAGAVTAPTGDGYDWYLVEAKGDGSAIVVNEKQFIALNKNSNLTLVAGDIITPLVLEGRIPAKKWGNTTESEMLDTTNLSDKESVNSTKIFKTYEDSNVIDMSGTLEMDFTRASDFQKNLFKQYFSTSVTNADGTFTFTEATGRKTFIIATLMDNTADPQQWITYMATFSPPPFEVDLMASITINLEVKVASGAVPTILSLETPT